MSKCHDSILIACMFGSAFWLPILLTNVKFNCEF